MTAVVIDAVRSPIGKAGGTLAGVRPDDLAARVLREAVSRAGIDPADVEDVILGCANQAGEESRDVARISALLADLPVEVGGVTVNRLCGNRLEAVAQAARAIEAGAGEVVVAGASRP